MPLRASEEPHPRRTGLVRKPLQRPQLPAHGRHVEALHRGSETPQVRGHARLHIGNMRDRVLQTGGDPESLGQVVRPPMHEQLRVKRLGQQRGVAGDLGTGHGFRGKLDATFRTAAEHPRPHERRREPRPSHPFRAAVGLEEERRHPPGMRAE
jgi:hypothetical protein